MSGVEVGVSGRLGSEAELEFGVGVGVGVETGGVVRSGGGGGLGLLGLVLDDDEIDGKDGVGIEIGGKIEGAVTDGRRGRVGSSPLPALEAGSGGVGAGIENVGRVAAVVVSTPGVFRVAVGKLGPGVAGDWPVSVSVDVEEELSKLSLIIDARSDDMSDPSIDEEDAAGRSVAGLLERVRAEKVVHGRVKGGNMGTMTGVLLGNRLARALWLWWIIGKMGTRNLRGFETGKDEILDQTGE